LVTDEVGGLSLTASEMDTNEQLPSSRNQIIYHTLADLIMNTLLHQTNGTRKNKTKETDITVQIYSLKAQQSKMLINVTA